MAYKSKGLSQLFPLRYEDRLCLWILAGGLPALLTSLYFLWISDLSLEFISFIAFLLASCWIGLALHVRSCMIHPLRTMSSMLTGLREGDYSTRARSGRTDDALGELFSEANALGKTLSEQRLTAVEATALLRSVMGAIDVAVFTFDEGHHLRLTNRAGESLLAQTADRLLNRTAASLGMEEFLEQTGAQIVERSFPCGTGRWGIHVSTIWERGISHRLLVVQDLTRALREEQLLAWKQLVRVIGHELNNSLTPIKSIAASLRTLLSREPAGPDWKEDADQGLAVIAGRAESLARFMDAYARLAKLPTPRREPLCVTDWVNRVVGLENRIPIRVSPSPPLDIRGDGDQLDQLLINILRNAAEAALETAGSVEIGWRSHRNGLELWVLDTGPGLPKSGNLFVPFFTTKTGGSGIGLVLSRQIAEAHGGELTLENRADGPGCRALLRLPGGGG